MKSILIKSATQKDVATLVEIENLCFATDKLDAPQFRAFLKKTSVRTLVAKKKQDVVGYGMILFRKNSRIARIYSIAVHPTKQGLGIASLLYEKMENMARRRGCHTVRSEVHKNNQRSIEFHLNRDYTVFGKYVKFYEDGATALRMKKMLAKLDNVKLK